MIRRNLSPGGCADLLALGYLLYFLRHEGEPARTEETPCTLHTESGS